MKTYKKFSVLLSLLLTAVLLTGQAAAVSSSTQTEDAKDLTAKTEFLSSASGFSAGKLKDGSVYTRWKFSGPAELALSCAEEIGGIYIIWNTPPAVWNLVAAGSTKQYGTHGFLHEYIKLDMPVQSMALQFDAESQTICDIYVFSEGNLPDWVEVWNPPYENADMLLIPTHADDEHLFFGGTMPYYAGELKRKVQVAYLTNHWGEWYRPHELLKGLWKVGVTAYPVISEFPDYYSKSLNHAKTLYDEEKILAFQVSLLRRFRPEVVIAHDFNGEYGHGVHMLNAHALAEALTISADPSRYPESVEQYGVWDVPKAYFHLYEENEIVMEWGELALSAFGGKSALELAEEGFAKHTSQQKYFKVRANGKNDCRKFGLYRSLVGEDQKKNDFFENIDWNVWDPVSSQPAASSEALDVSVPAPAISSQPSNAKPAGNWIWLIGLGIVLALLLSIGIIFVIVRGRRKNK